MFDKLWMLKQKGYSPDTILDIGAHHGYWTQQMKTIFGDSTYHLFEAIDYSELKRFNNNNKVKVYNILLHDKIEQVNWYQMKNTGDSMFREKTHHFANCEIIKRETIDLNTFILQKNLLKDSKHILMKIDCQGAEIPILKGSTSILEKTDFIILEIPLFGQYNEGVPTFLEHISFMESIGFTTYDIIDNHYINGFNMQVDILFINKNHIFNNIVNKLLLL
jgi:FkbM family methyltransferase